MVVLYLAVSIYPGLGFDGTIRTLLLATVALTLLNRIVKPLIKLLLLPINLLTLGIFGWVAHVATLFILTRVVDGFYVRGYSFPGLNLDGFVAPPMEFSAFASLIIGSMTISVIANIVSWLLRK